MSAPHTEIMQSRAVGQPVAFIPRRSQVRILPLQPKSKHLYEPDLGRAGERPATYFPNSGASERRNAAAYMAAVPRLPRREVLPVETQPGATVPLPAPGISLGEG